MYRKYLNSYLLFSCSFSLSKDSSNLLSSIDNADGTETKVTLKINIFIQYTIMFPP